MTPDRWPAPWMPAGRTQTGFALIGVGMLLAVAACASCASDTQPYPPGFFGFVAPRSWDVPLMLATLAGVGMAGAGLVLLITGISDRSRRHG